MEPIIPSGRQEDRTKIRGKGISKIEDDASAQNRGDRRTMGSLRSDHDKIDMRELISRDTWKRRESTLSESELRRFEDYVKRLIQDRILADLRTYGDMTASSLSGNLIHFEIGHCSVHPGKKLISDVFQELLRGAQIETDAPKIEDFQSHILRLSDPPPGLTDLETKILAALDLPFTKTDKDIKRTIRYKTGIATKVADIRKALAALEKSGKIRKLTPEEYSRAAEGNHYVRI